MHHLTHYTLLAWLLVTTLSAQDRPHAAVDSTLRESTVSRIGDLLTEHYVFADKGKACAERLAERLANGAYDAIDEPAAFAAALTRDLQGLTHDKHLNVRVSAPRSGSVDRPDPEDLRRRQLARARRANFGFQSIEILDGNVGYLDLRGFFPAEHGGEAATAAMAFLANTDAMIIDLRRNGGGSPSMIQLLSTYFFENRTHLNSFFWRGKDQIDQFWTLPHVPGRRRPDVPLYVLTSGRTFSAAEEFTYNLKNLGRAKIVGETTGGGAHPGGSRPVNELFMLWIPQGRAINPVTGTNWEGTGIEPDLAVAADMALDAAHKDALETLVSAVVDPREREALEWSLVDLASKLEPVEVSAERLQRLAGTYGPRHLTFDGERLWYQREGNARHRLVAMPDGLFRPEGLDHFRIRFEEEDGRIARLIGIYRDGRRDVSERTDG